MSLYFLGNLVSFFQCDLMGRHRKKGWEHSPVETLAEVGGLRACSFRATTLTMYSSPGFSPVWLKDVTSLGSWAITPPSLFWRVGRKKEQKRQKRKVTGREKCETSILNCSLKMGPTSVPMTLTAEFLEPGKTPNSLSKNLTAPWAFGKWRINFQEHFFGLPWVFWVCQQKLVMRRCGLTLTKVSMFDGYG